MALYDGTDGDDKWRGDGANDVAFGHAGNDRIRGGRGNDELHGGGGDDHLYAGPGTDTLDGGEGQDRLTGGAGADVFVFVTNETSADAALADRIADFSQTDRDVIDLTHYDAVPGNSTVDRFILVGTQEFQGDLGELRYEISDGDTLVSGDTDGDMVADFYIRLEGTFFLGGSDFLLGDFATLNPGAGSAAHADLAANPLLHLV